MTEPTDLSDPDTIPARRRRTGADPATEPVDGSTVIARRESRRRAGRDRRPGPPPPAPVAPASAGRAASAPDPASRVVYEPRRAEPVVTTRAAPAARAPQTPIQGPADGAGDRRSARRTAAIVLLAASAVSVGAAASLIVLLSGS